MTNRPYDQPDVPQLQRPLSSDLNQLGSLLYYTMLFGEDCRLSPLSGTGPGAGIPVSGFVNEGFRPFSDGTTLNVYVSNGLGFLVDSTTTNNIPTPSGPAVVGVSDLSRIKPLALKATAQFTAPAPDPTQDRYDIIEVRDAGKYADAAVLDFFDTGSSQFVPASAFKTYSRAELDTQLGYQLVSANLSTAGLSYKIGVPGAGVPPATSAGYERIAVIKVPAAATALSDLLVLDDRQLLAPAMLQPIAVRWSVAGTDPTGTISLLQAALPPGWKVAIEGNTGLTPNGWRIWIIAGRGVVDLVGATCNSQFVSTSGSAAIEPALGQVRGAPTVGTISGSQQTLLASSANVVPNIEVAVGQPYISIDVQACVYDTTAPAWVFNALPNPFQLNFSAIAKLV